MIEGLVDPDTAIGGPNRHFPSTRQTLLDAETVGWFRENELLVFAWTVNTLPRANELVGYGVDAITTDNLGILSLFSGSEIGLPASTPVSPPS